ncbi:hypothetical protein BH09ACT12_BH09ACT12_02240 [soil metagenome]
MLELGALDHYARLVKRLLNVPIGLATLLEAERQVFPGAAGLAEPLDAARETPLSHSFCQYVVKDQRPLVVSDARQDARLADNLAIEDLGVIAYAGWPLTDHTGRAVGSLCAIDTAPREWTAEEIETLEDLAMACSAELTERQRAAQTTAALLAAQQLGDRSRALLALSTGLSFTETIAGVADAVARVSTEQLGCERAGMWLRESAQQIAAGSVRSADGAVSDRLYFVGNPLVTWRSAEAFAELPLDPSNPLGGALSESTALFYDSRSEQNDVYPQLVNPDQLGEARAFVPLLAGGRAYGALALVWPEVRSFSEDDRITIAAMAAYTAQAVHRAQLFEERVAVAWTLQSAMLTSLPQPDRLELAGTYRPAHSTEQVGGDWYDAVVMPGGATHLMIGDVEGHNIQAAAKMGQLRSMLRMVAWMSQTPPSADLERLDLAIRDFDVDTTASVLLARIEQTETDADSDRWRLRWSNAGHLPPLLVEPDGTARYLTCDDEGSDVLLGVVPGVVRHDLDVPILPGSLLLLFTDGLVERRGESLDTGLERLREVAERASLLRADEFLDRIVAELASSSPEDDVAVLAVRFAPGA